MYRSKIYGGTFSRQTRHVLPSYWRFDAFVGSKINKNWTLKLFANNIFNKLYYDALVSERRALRAGSTGTCRVSDDLGALLIGEVMSAC